MIISITVAVVIRVVADVMMRIALYGKMMVAAGVVEVAAIMIKTDAF